MSGAHRPPRDVSLVGLPVVPATVVERQPDTSSVLPRIRCPEPS